jgi:hypothetical protein
LEEIQRDLDEPVPGHNAQRKKEKVTMVKKVEKKAGAVKSDKKADAKPEKKASKKVEKEDDGMVTLADLAAEAKIGGAAARRKIRASEMERGEGRWAWPEGSKQLRTARAALGLS